MRDVYIGALSGTSMDALDVAAVRFPPPNQSRQNGGRVELLADVNREIPQTLRDRLLALQKQNVTTLQQAADEHETLGRLFADAIKHLIRRHLPDDAVRAVGLHGQTLLHRPGDDPPLTLQIGDPRVVAEQTGCDTVSDFRLSDLAVGGQGAPLAPVFHDAFFSQAGKTQAVVNVGGISNVTWLESDGGYSGYDCGPGNILLDAWNRRHRRGAYDRDGEWARSGVCDESLLARMLEDEFFTRRPPKSACASGFGPAWLESKMPPRKRLKPEDVQASLTELTARCIADAVQARPQAPARVLICGGGAHNGYLMERLRALLAAPVEDTRAAGLSPDWVEAAGFAFLARRRLAHEATDLRSVTGARKPAVLGVIYAASP